MTAFYQLILRNNLLAMSNLSEIIQQLKSNQEAFNAKLAKVEDLGAKVSKSVLRDLIQDARELHEGTVVLSYILFNEESTAESEQLEIQLEPAKMEPVKDLTIEEESTSEEEELINALEKALDNTHQEVATESMVSEIAEEINEIEVETINVDSSVTEEDIPSQEELTGQLEEGISSVIADFSASSKPASFETGNLTALDPEDNSLAARLAKQRIENLNSAIGINEKFLFTNELFDGNTEQFLKTIDDLNNCVNLEDATAKLSTLAQKRNWELEEEPYQKLQALLSRKYH